MLMLHVIFHHTLTSLFIKGDTFLSVLYSPELDIDSKIFSLSQDNKIIFTSFNDYVMGFDLKSGLEVFKFHDQNIKITSLNFKIFKTQRVLTTLTIIFLSKKH